jgi:hypothetical protein
MTVSSPPGVPPPPPTSPATKKGLPPLAWVGIGCGVLLVLCLIGFGIVGYFVKKKVAEFGDNPEMAAAELIVAANPDVEKVSSDPEAKTITVRDKKTGDVMTLNLADLKEGRFEVRNDKGEVVSIGAQGATVTDEKGQTSTYGATAGTGDVPSWVPTYPGGQAQGAFNANTPEGKAGTFSVSTGDPVDQVMEFYEVELKEAGFNVSTTNTSSSDGNTGGTVTGTTEDEKRTIGVLVSTGDQGGSQAMITYGEKQ